MRKLFGTDGIRGVAGRYPLDRKTVYAIGQAVAHSLRKHRSNPSVLIGMDTRESSTEIAAVLSHGLRQGGAETTSAGVIPTPGVAYLARIRGFTAGIVISASHNPWEDNGIKIFGGDGYKLADAVELAIEHEIFASLAENHEPDFPKAEALELDPSLPAAYIQFLREQVPDLRLDGKTIVVDCANGAASAIAPPLLAHFGGDILLTHVCPNGRNINDHCGALHPEVVAQEVLARKADFGMTFDGDADRALFADEHGKVVNGDAVLLIAARDLHARGLLKANLVVATTMSNMGLEAALRTDQIKMLRAPVGDKYVLEEMQKHGAVLGGEQSGHMLFLDRSTTGDGLLTALLVLDIVQRSSESLSALTLDLKVFPQVIVNVRVREKQPLETLPNVVAAIRDADLELHGNGRVVVRYSGTEALARVMIEAESEQIMRRHAERIAEAIRAELGV
ncbi:MAG TPA: phosphoglucosamine mutase [Acidobacteriaceae bacterium]|nr:phosphoglucosamine mutase [Acidobacteriaceae bacterium]